MMKFQKATTILTPTAVSIQVAMDISARKSFYSEIARMLRPRGRFCT